jgi:hypothetical protein
MFKAQPDTGNNKHTIAMKAQKKRFKAFHPFSGYIT